jgi:hypothetical protein
LTVRLLFVPRGKRFLFLKKRIRKKKKKEILKILKENTKKKKRHRKTTCFFMALKIWPTVYMTPRSPCCLRLKVIEKKKIQFKKIPRDSKRVQLSSSDSVVSFISCGFPPLKLDFSFLSSIGLLTLLIPTFNLTTTSIANVSRFAIRYTISLQSNNVVYYQSPRK